MEIRDQYKLVNERIVRAAENAGRNPSEITLVAVTKTKPVAVPIAAYHAGIQHFGENRPAELAKKRPEVEVELGESNSISWHFIGHVQSRKVRLVATHADFLHSLDSVRLARKLSRHLGELGREFGSVKAGMPALLEVNISGEASKGGFDVNNWEQDVSQREKFMMSVREIAELPHLKLQGLMTMARWGAPEAEIRDVFRRTRKLSEWLQQAVPEISWQHLSMGMTDDFELAIAEGATLVRVGRALFGER